MNTETILSVLKWVALIFIAGLIGYFGKYLGQVIVSMFKKKGHTEPRIQTDINEDKTKLKKKRLKAKIKQNKKKK